MNKPQIIYCVLNGELEHLELQGDYPNKPNTLLYRSLEKSELLTISDGDMKEKHIYFTDRNKALQQVIKWHQNEIEKIEYIINHNPNTNEKGNI